MDDFLGLFSYTVEQLLGRASGPLRFRLFVMPTVVTFLAVRAGLRDAREGQPPFLWAILTNRARRRPLVIRALKGIGKILIMATVLDTIYQLVFLRAMHLFQLAIVVIVCAIVPYVAIRGPVTRIASFVRRKRTMAVDELEPSR